MKVHTLSILTAALLAVAACSPAVTSRDGANTGDSIRLPFAQSVDIAGAGARLAALRAQNGLGALRHSSALQAAAQAHANDMASSGNFSHNGSNGSNLRSRIRAAGYNACFMAENIAYGQGAVGQVINDWSASRGHQRNMLSPQATQFGFARAGTYWVLVVGRNC